MRRRRMIRWAALTILMLPAVAAAPAPDVPARPNVILCMADDLGWGDTGYNGHPVIRTPNLDRMAREGLRLDRFYAASAICSPTRASVLTGRSPQRAGIVLANHGFLSKDEVTLADVLREHGYATGHFGKWHLGALSRTIVDGRRGGPEARSYAPPWEHGFEVAFATEGAVPTWNPMDQQVMKRQQDKRGKERQGPYPSKYWTGEGLFATDDLEGDDSRVIMDRAIGFIEKSAKSRRPFLAVIWFHTPHAPVIAGPNYRKPYEELADEGSALPDYAGAITAMDEQIGRLRRTLKRLDIADNTMLWFTSDNGAKGRRGRGTSRGGKGNLYEGGIRVPGLLVWPDRVPEHRIVSMDCHTDDYFPTVLDAAGIDPPQDRKLDGISLLPMIEGEMDRRPRPMAFELGHQRAYLDRPHKLFSSDGGKTFALYDLDQDPGEQNDIAAAHPKLVASMEQGLDRWRASCAASRETTTPSER